MSPHIHILGTYGKGSVRESSEKAPSVRAWGLAASCEPGWERMGLCTPRLENFWVQTLGGGEGERSTV